MLRFLRYILEAIAAFVGVTIILGLLLLWRIGANPVSSDFLTPYIEAGIEGIVPGSQVHLGSTLLTWNGGERSVTVHAENIKVSDEAGGTIADIPTFEAKISIFGLLFGQFMPEDLDVDHPQIRLERGKDGLLVFGGMTVSGANAAPKSLDTINEVVRNLSRHFSKAALMHKLSVTRAVFDIHDTTTQKDWAVSIPEISITRSGFGHFNHLFERGALDGHMTVEVTQKDNLASLEIHYTYDPLAERHTLSSIFHDVTPAFLAGGHPETLGLSAASIIDLPLTGKLKVTFDKNLTIDDVDAEIHGDEGQLVYQDFWDKPCQVKSFDLSAVYDRKAHELVISDTHIDFNGPILDLEVDGAAPTHEGQDLSYAAVLKVENMPMNRYGELWPKPVLSDPRYWLVSSLRDGNFTHGEVKIKGGFAWSNLANLSVDDGGGKISATGGRVTYIDGMPPVENVDATATFDMKKMDVQILAGGIGNVHVMPFTLEITGLSDPDQDITIPLQVTGPIPDVLHLLDHEPLGYAKALGLQPSDIDGQIEGTVTFHFPLLKTLEMKDIAIHATATTSLLASNKLVPGLTIDQGSLALTLDTSSFALSGQAFLDKVPFQVLWEENFEAREGKPLRHALVTGTVKDDQWGNFGITAFNGTKGPIALTLDMIKPDKNKMLLSGTVDMTPAAIAIDQLDWKKPANSPATLKFSATSVPGKPVEVSSLSLRGAQIRADGDATLSADMSQLLALNLSPLVLGRTSVNLTFSQSFGEGGALNFEADGNALDVSGLRGGNDPESADPRPKDYRINVDRLYTAPNGVIEEAQGNASRDQEGWRSISLHGLADGDMPISMNLTPQSDGHRTLLIECQNFGKAMKGLGFTDTIKGGKLTISGQSTVESPRVVMGKVKIGDFTVEKLPVLALLLNATSPFGFGGLITDSADFSHFQGEFRWQGDTLTLMRTNVSGSAVGINIDGKVDMNSGEANLQGTLVPFSTVNNILNYIPLIGNLLTGGENQGVLAVSYDIKGKLSAPKVSVNPVSLLTPGFIRNLFFSDDTTDDTP